MAFCEIAHNYEQNRVVYSVLQSLKNRTNSSCCNKIVTKEAFAHYTIWVWFLIVAVRLQIGMSVPVAGMDKPIARLLEKFNKPKGTV